MRILVLFFIFFSFAISSQISVFKVEGMHCPLCTTAVNKLIQNLMEMIRLELDLIPKR